MKNFLHRLGLGLALWVFPVYAPAQFTFGLGDGNTLTVVGYNTAAGLNAVIPATVNGTNVTGIAANAFSSSSITNVVIPNTITNIGDYAFYFCRYLRDVTLPASLKTVGRIPFDVCFSITNINVDPANTNFSSPGGVWYDKQVTNLIEYPAGRLGPYSPPEGVVSVGFGALAGCRLSSFTFPTSLTNLEHYAFDGCMFLTNFITPKANPAFMAIDGVLYNKNLDTLVVYPGGLTNTFVMPSESSITSIGYAAFMDAQLAGIVFSSNVRDIGALAFVGCLGLTSIVIPGSVTNVQPYAFNECPFLTRVYFLGNKPPSIDPYNPFSFWTLNDAFQSSPATLFYMPGTTGWTEDYGSVSLKPTLLWNPHFGSFAFTNNSLQLTCTIPSNSVVVLENCTNLALNAWQPLATNTYVYAGPFSFTNLDTEITKKPASFYRFRSP